MKRGKEQIANCTKNGPLEADILVVTAKEWLPHRLQLIGLPTSRALHVTCISPPTT